jgi:nicotinamidase-related amidase
MATVRAGHRSAVVVVDVQKGVVAEAHLRDEVIAAIGALVNKARAAKVPVLWVHHSDDELVHGSEAWQWAEGLSPRDDERQLDKHYNSCFEGTGFEAELEALGITRLVLAGAATNWCIRATAYAALERGYDLSLVADAHTTGSAHAPELIDDLNTAMRWLAYPGRKNESVTAAEATF